MKPLSVDKQREIAISIDAGDREIVVAGEGGEDVRSGYETEGGHVTGSSVTTVKLDGGRLPEGRAKRSSNRSYRAAAPVRCGRNIMLAEGGELGGRELLKSHNIQRAGEK